MKKGRIEEVDVLRGIVMLLMALDHVRDFLGNFSVSALDLAETTPPLFFTRWITHFCAPTFVLLAGMSAFLMRRGRDSASSAAKFLFLRGFMLVLIEQTALRCLGWYFNFDYRFMNANVLFGIGCSMMLLSAFMKLPPRAVLVTGSLIIALHNLWDLAAIAPHAWWRPAMIVLFRAGDIAYAGGCHLYISYPVLPWFGLMALGFGLGPLLLKEEGARKRSFLFTGLSMVAGFIILRGLNWYGDPAGWAAMGTSLFTVMSFINVNKYPPSLLFTLMTAGTGLVALALIPRMPSMMKRVLTVYGCVPLFFYLIHIPIVHGLAVLYSFLRFGAAGWLYRGPGIFWYDPLPGHPPDYGLGLAWVYTIWICVAAFLYFLCRWYGEIKRERGRGWMRYL